MEFEPGSVAAIGRAMYDEIRDEMERKYWGWMVVIDIHSGDYEIGADDITATLRLLERRPDALTWGELVGYPASCAIGTALVPYPRGADGLSIRPEGR